MTNERPTHGFVNPRRGSARTAGLLAAAGVAVLGAASVGYFIWKAPPRVEPADALKPSDRVPDIKSLTGGGGQSVVSRLGSNTGPFMQIADKNDPSRVAGELSADRSELLPDKRYLLIKPRAWTFLRDGRSLLIEAEKGRAYIPDESPDGRPDEALLEGNVVIRLFDKPAQGERPDPTRDTPLFTARTQTLSFDGTLGQIVTPGELLVEATGGVFKGSGMTLLINEVSERVEYLKVEKTEYIEVMPKVASGTPEAAGSPVGAKEITRPAATEAGLVAVAPAQPAADAAPVAAATPERAPARTTDYLATCDGNVAIVQGGRAIRGDSLSAWVRSTQSAKAKRTSSRGGIESMWPLAMIQPEPEAKLIEAALPTPGQPETAASQPAERAPIIPDADSEKPVRLTFDGVLELRPLAIAPVQLKHNEAFVRITSTEEGGVTAMDKASGASVSAILAEYGATRRDVAFGSNEPMGVLLSAPGSGTAAAQRLELSLANGRAHVTGAGSLADEAAGAGDSTRSVTWSDSADFRFAVVDGRMTGRLAEAFLSGTVRAADDESEFNAARVQATFDAVGEKGRLARLFLAGRAWGSDGAGGQLSANTIDVRFAPDSPESTASSPSAVMARGNVVAAQPDNALWAEGLDVSLGRVDGTMVATRAFASGPVFFQNADGVMAQSDTLVAWPGAKRIELAGPSTAISKATTLIAGPTICLDGDAHTMVMPSAGIFTHTSELDGVQTRSGATWAGSMRFDDAAGVLMCDGRTQATSSKVLANFEMQRDTMIASGLEITLAAPERTGGDAASNEAEPAPSSLPMTSGRAVAVVRALGGAAGPAKVESRSYADGAGGPALQQLFYLESGTIEADSLAGELRVPGAGKLLAVDRRPGRKGPGSGELSESMSDSKGNSLFAWSESMRLARESGLATMLGSVKLVHDRLEGDERVMLECRQLEAKLAMGGAGASATSGRLSNAVATDRVWMRYGGRELTARVLSYDAETDIVTANGDGIANPVSMLDLSKGTPFNAQSILWNLSTNRFEAKQLSPIVMPR